MAENVVFPAGLSGEEIGQVVGFFAIPSAAILEIKKDSLKVGDRIWIKGNTTDLVETVSSMQVEHTPVSEANKGSQVGVKVSTRVRRHDRVYKVS